VAHNVAAKPHFRVGRRGLATPALRARGKAVRAEVARGEVARGKAASSATKPRAAKPRII